MFFKSFNAHRLKTVLIACFAGIELVANGVRHWRQSTCAERSYASSFATIVLFWTVSVTLLWEQSNNFAVYLLGEISEEGAA